MWQIYVPEEIIQAAERFCNILEKLKNSSSLLSDNCVKSQVWNVLQSIIELVEPILTGMLPSLGRLPGPVHIAPKSSTTLLKCDKFSKIKGYKRLKQEKQLRFHTNPVLYKTGPFPLLDSDGS